MSSQLSADVCQSFLVGCDELVDKSLQGAISSLEELEVKAQQLGDVSAAKIVRLYTVTASLYSEIFFDKIGLNHLLKLFFIYGALKKNVTKKYVHSYPVMEKR